MLYTTIGALIKPQDFSLSTYIGMLFQYYIIIVLCLDLFMLGEDNRIGGLGGKNRYENDVSFEGNVISCAPVVVYVSLFVILLA